MAKRKKSAMADAFSAPVDPELFLEMLTVWHDAASTPLRREDWRPNDDQPLGLVLSDIPINRSALAVTGALKKREVEDAVRQSCLSRLMHVGEVMENRGRFARFIKPGTEPDMLEISDALLKACAVAKMIVDGEHFGFDLDDVLARAIEFEAAEVRH